jgi:hypothetical protein
MLKQRHRAILEKALLATAVVFLLIGIIGLGFLQSLSKDGRSLIVIVSSVGLIASFVGMMSANAFWKWLRMRTWRRAMSAWRESSQFENAPKSELAWQLSEGGLRNLAIQIYSRMGYIIINRDGGEVTIQLVNPEGRIELATIEQQPDPAEIRNILSLHLEMKRTGAVRGFFWSPSGFTHEARHWTRLKPIVLIDQDKIGRLIDCAYEKGSSIFESG